ncbi:MAG: hypothetical protein M3N00_04135, partial [Actinomycetota bacterium]|nr:hypothetical protein [Actinomycetota bacterium]
MSRRGMVGARGIFLLIFVFVCAGCAQGEGSADRTSKGEQSSRAEKSSEQTMRGSNTSLETTGDSEETTTGTGDGDPAASESGGGTDQESGSRPPETLVAGAKDRTGGPLVEHRLVSYYGHPFSGAMGVLGQLEPEAMVKELKEQTKAYTKVDPDLPAIPTIELIASVAQPTPGADGLYLKRTPTSVIEKYAKVAEENGCQLLLDVQIGYSTIADEVEVLMPFLEREHVHLAIDTEYDMAPGEVPGEQIGSSSGREIMGAARTLSKLVKRKDLPPKVLVIHQFAYSMITNKEVIEPVPNVEIVLHADGFGTPREKIVKYNALVRDQPIQYGGFKLFYEQDAP